MKVEQFIDAIDKNGYPRGHALFEVDYNRYKFAACALGQGLLNMNLITEAEAKIYAIQGNHERAYNLIKFEDLNPSQTLEFKTVVMIMNDQNNYSCKKIAKKLREKYL